jgi:hypothetical protein
MTNLHSTKNLLKIDGMPLHIYILRHYFEGISLIYHMVFIGFLLWVIAIRKPGEKIDKMFIRGLGIYVIFYGFIIVYYGPTLFNDEL